MAEFDKRFLAALALLITASSHAAEPTPAASVVRFYTVCANCHEGQCSGRLTFHTGATEARVRFGCPGRPLQPHSLGRKTDVIMNIQRPGLVMGVEIVIALAEHLRIGPPDVGGEHTPAIVRIDRQQGVIKIKQHQSGFGGGHSFSSMDLTRGMVTARCFCRA